MNGLNKVTLLGNVGKDPELHATKNNSSVVNFPLATTESWKNKDGEWDNRTEWHKIVAWGNKADYAGKYFKKGFTVLVEGKLQTRKYDDKNGVTHYVTEIVASDFILISSGAKGATNPGPQPKQQNLEEEPSDFETTLPDDEDYPF